MSHIILTSDRCSINRNCTNATIRPPQKLAAAAETTTTVVHLFPLVALCNLKKTHIFQTSAVAQNFQSSYLVMFLPHRFA
jgi:hypothetical protein